MKSSDRMIELAKEFKIMIYEPFAEFLESSKEEIHFEISLLDCYRLAGHACHSVTGAFLVTQVAVEKLFPESKVCERGDLRVDFGSKLEEVATGPRSNIVSYITGAWGETGFPGLKSQFCRKNLVSFGHSELSKRAIRFTRNSTGKSVAIEYDSAKAIQSFNHGLPFPESWRVEIIEILKNKNLAINIQNR